MNVGCDTVYLSGIHTQCLVPSSSTVNPTVVILTFRSDDSVHDGIESCRRHKDELPGANRRHMAGPDRFDYTAAAA